MKTWIIAPVLLLATLSCSRRDTNTPSATPMGEWHRPWNPRDWKGFKKLATALYSEVVDTREAEAQALLADQRAHVLSSDEAAHYWKGSLPVIGEDQVFVLLRAIATEKEDVSFGVDDRFEVQIRSGVVWVVHFAHRKNQNSTGRRAVVAVLPRGFGEVYNDVRVVRRGGYVSQWKVESDER